MHAQISLDEAIGICEMAFLPCRAIAHPDQCDASFSLRVIDPSGNEILAISHIARTQYTAPAHLAAVLESARLELSKDGVALSAWSLPAQPGIAD